MSVFRGHLRALPLVATTEAVATVRSALWPLARLRPLPPAPTAPSTPVVLVHGYLGHPDMWRPLTRRLYQAGRGRVHRVGYPSTRLTLDQIAHRIGEEVSRASQEGPIDLVGHSLGAVACRAWLKVFDGARHVRRFVSLGGPHAGTAMYRFTPPILWEVLDPDGPWVHRLAEGEEPVPTTVIRARYDHQVLPPVRASLPGVDEVVLHGCGHNGLLWRSEAHEAVVDALSAP
jgi:pimeloyl-ACP methyl ester carboxylesterase